MIPTLVWTLPRPAKSRYKSAFPLYFEENLVQLLGYPERILHYRSDRRPQIPTT